MTTAFARPAQPPDLSRQLNFYQLSETFGLGDPDDHQPDRRRRRNALRRPLRATWRSRSVAGLYELNHGTPAPEVAAKLGGGIAGTFAGGKIGALIGAPAGPVGVAIGAFVFATAGGFGGEWLGEMTYEKLGGPQ